MVVILRHSETLLSVEAEVVTDISQRTMEHREDPVVAVVMAVREERERPDRDLREGHHLVLEPVVEVVVLVLRVPMRHLVRQVVLVRRILLSVLTSSMAEVVEVLVERVDQVEVDLVERVEEVVLLERMVSVEEVARVVDTT